MVKSTVHNEASNAVSIGYMPGLDGLRALAVFAVIAYHLGVTWTPGGLLGVNLFFVLSGYLITSILYKQLESEGSIDLKDFWLRRAKRLLPALFLMLISVMLWALVFAPDRLTQLRQEALAAALYSGNWYFIFRQVSYFESFGPPSPLGHLWSLAIEEQFYLLWPLILSLVYRLIPRRKWIISIMVFLALISAGTMALIYIPGTDPSRVYYGTDTRAFALLAGAIAAMILPCGNMSLKIDGSKRKALALTGSMSLIITLWMIFRINQYQVFLYQGGLFIFSVAAAFLVAALAHPAGFLGRIFSIRPLRLLGKWSYGIYLWHYPVIVLSSSLVDTDGPDILHSVFQIAVSILLAVISYYFIEEPIRHGRVRALALSARVSVSAALIFAVMLVTSMEGMQILAKDLSGEQETAGYSKELQSHTESPIDTEAEAEAPPEGHGNSITVIADSMMINVEPALQESLPGIIVDAEKGRQMYDAPEVIQELREKGKLGKYVIIVLGTNGAFTEKQLKTTIDCLEGAEEIILINTRVPKPWQGVVNEMLTNIVDSYYNVRLIDWFAESSGHNEYFYKDGVHLNPSGIEAYCKMIIDALSESQS